MANAASVLVPVAELNKALDEIGYLRNELGAYEREFWRTQGEVNGLTTARGFHNQLRTRSKHNMMQALRAQALYAHHGAQAGGRGTIREQALNFRGVEQDQRRRVPIRQDVSERYVDFLLPTKGYNSRKKSSRF
ncbi:hypothetical protein L5515_017324 [Caenorhabditis briggsae]|uniref:Uncharacterized protein n=1 Tax=Caenorhabditis briggsae TaxID=6238 RepID=A0AAE9JRE2_CAEBR|nr:hypothetical protein L5515_017324 [Caenorhabditis briggsae]